ncbi:MAG: transposase, partial [Candidatus Sungbacteria bacterium]|nr:transposase [Candidatus Sungbacteria bacterium]
RIRVRDQLITRLQTITLPHPNDPQKLKTIKESLRKNTDAYVTCLTHEGIPADNNKAERALRHLVLKRKISFGSRTQKGTDTLSALASVLLSLWWRKPQNFFGEYLGLRGV